jgi:flagellar basal-body rod protein FlgB
MVIPGLDQIGAALALGALRQRVLAHDLANASTPGFVPADIEIGSPPFGAQLAEALRLARTDPRHLEGEVAGSGLVGAVVVRSAVLMGPNGNGVDMDAAMAALAANALWYRALAAAASGELAMARAALE